MLPRTTNTTNTINNNTITINSTFTINNTFNNALIPTDTDVMTFDGEALELLLRHAIAGRIEDVGFDPYDIAAYGVGIMSKVSFDVPSRVNASLKNNQNNQKLNVNENDTSSGILPKLSLLGSQNSNSNSKQELSQLVNSLEIINLSSTSSSSSLAW